mgnify:FL=1
MNSIETNLKKIKSTSFWYFFIKFFLKNIYFFFWRFALNFHGCVLYFLWFIKKRPYYDLNEKNYLVLKNDDELIKFSKEISKKISKEKLEKLKSDMVNGNIKTTNETNTSKNTYKTDIFFELDNDLQRKIVEFASSEKMISTAAKHMKIFPIISRIILNYNIINTEKQRGAMLWHRDAFGYRSLDVFISLTDVDQNNGPLSVLTEENELGIFSRNKNEKNFAVAGERGKIDDSSVNSEGKTIDNIGEMGTAVLIDSYVSYHKGGNCKNKERMMLRISYQGVDAIDFRPQGDYFIFDKSIQKKNIKSHFKKFVLFKRSKILNILNVRYKLLRFYRFMQYYNNN